MTELRDLELKGVSNCCSAKVYEPDICSDCKEHCGVVTEAEAHLEAVKSGDEDCKPMCGVCREYAHDLQDLTHEKT